MDDLNIRKSIQHNCANCNWIEFSVEYDEGYAYWSGRVEADCSQTRCAWDSTLTPIKSYDGVVYAVDTPGSQICNKWSERE